MKEKDRERVCGCNYMKYSYSFSANIFTLNIHFVQTRLKQNKSQTKKIMAKYLGMSTSLSYSACFFLIVFLT